MTTWFMGIDPGKTGGVGVYEPETGHGTAWRFPGDEYMVARLLDDILTMCGSVRLAVMERVGSRPENGVRQAFSFGVNVGIWRGSLACKGIRFQEITPQEWMRGTFDARAGSASLQGKARSLDLARRLFPIVDLRFKADDGKAEALLMAKYASTLS